MVIADMEGYERSALLRMAEAVGLPTVTDLLHFAERTGITDGYALFDVIHKIYTKERKYEIQDGKRTLRDQR